MTPVVSIQNLGPEKFQEGVSRELVSLKVCDLSKKGNPFTQISKYWPRAKVRNISLTWFSLEIYIALYVLAKKPICPVQQNQPSLCFWNKSVI